MKSNFAENASATGVRGARCFYRDSSVKKQMSTLSA
jgi:hypothetical protein